MDHPGLTVWFTGLSISDQRRICNGVYDALAFRGFSVELLDSNEVHAQLCDEPGIKREDVEKTARKIGFVANLLTRHDVIVLVSSFSPNRVTRNEIRRSIGSFMEVYVNSPPEVFEQSSPAPAGGQALTGSSCLLNIPHKSYEPPLAPEVECRTDLECMSASVMKVMSEILRRMSPPRPPAAAISF